MEIKGHRGAFGTVGDCDKEIDALRYYFTPFPINSMEMGVTLLSAYRRVVQ